MSIITRVVQLDAGLKQPGIFRVAVLRFLCPVRRGYSGRKQTDGDDVHDNGHHAPVDLVVKAAHPALASDG